MMDLWNQKYPEMIQDMMSAMNQQAKASQMLANGVLKYCGEFVTPLWTSLNAFLTTEKSNYRNHSLSENISDYLDLYYVNQIIFNRGFESSMESIRYHFREFNNASLAWLNTVTGNEDGGDIRAYSERLYNLIHGVVKQFPEEVLKIESEFGFHFDEDGYEKVAETERMLLYQIFPIEKQTAVNKKGKPTIIIPPYVLGPNILGFLPREGKSYAHSFANQGIPTYIRVIKDIDTTPAVQVMKPEDEVSDTRRFCEILKRKHNCQVTLNGYCQGGFMAVSGLLTGEMDGLVDAVITCVAPIDGTRSIALSEFMNQLPSRFKNLAYATKTLPNGNPVIDGKVMSWVYKLKSMEKEAPIFSFYRDMMMFDRGDASAIEVSKTAAAINYWLLYDRTDLPVDITKMSFDSYTIPITKDGTFPIKIFGRRLNFDYIKEKKIKLLICYAEQDDLVDKPAILAPLDYIDAEVTAFPKGHGAIATSWSLPSSKYALHKKFADNSRGPVRFQLDLQEEVQKKTKRAPKK